MGGIFGSRFTQQERDDAISQALLGLGSGLLSARPTVGAPGQRAGALGLLGLQQGLSNAAQGRRASREIAIQEAEAERKRQAARTETANRMGLMNLLEPAQPAGEVGTSQILPGEPGGLIGTSAPAGIQATPVGLGVTPRALPSPPPAPQSQFTDDQRRRARIALTGGDQDAAVKILSEDPRSGALKEIDIIQRRLARLPQNAPNRPALEARLSKLTTSQPLIQQIGGKDLSELQKKLSQVEATRLGGFVDVGDTATEQLVEIDTLERQLASGLTTGALTPLATSVSGLARSVGLDPESVGLADPSNAQAFTAGVNRVVQRMTQNLKGALSEKELAFLQRSTVSLANTPEANAQIIAVMRKGLRQQQGRAIAAEEWIEDFGSLRAKNEDGQNFSRAWSSEVRDSALPDDALVPITRRTPRGNREIRVDRPDLTGGTGEAEAGQQGRLEGIRSMDETEVRKLDPNSLSQAEAAAALERLRILEAIGTNRGGSVRLR